jgi:hypothetical protein
LGNAKERKREYFQLEGLVEYILPLADWLIADKLPAC